MDRLGEVRGLEELEGAPELRGVQVQVLEAQPRRLGPRPKAAEGRSRSRRPPKAEAEAAVGDGEEGREGATPKHPTNHLLFCLSKKGEKT